MKRSTIGALLIWLLIMGGGYLVVKIVMPWAQQRTQLRTSDAQGKISTTLRIGGDNYLGYWFINSPELKKQLVRQGIQVDFLDDGGAYADRLEKFNKKELDMIVLPVNSYLEHGAKHNYPGVITASISESKGADGIVGFADKLPTGKIQDLNNPNLKIVYTGQSPSSFLLDLTITDFDLFNLQKKNQNWRQEVASSEEAYNKARKHEGDVFVLWEPDLSKALELPGVKYIWGSNSFAGYIIDVFVVRRDFLENNQEAILNFFKTYFRVMAMYANNRENMVSEMAKSTSLKKDVVEEMLKKIDWYDLHENGLLQFGISNNPGARAKDGLIDTIIQCSEVIRRSGRVNFGSLDPYLITNRTIVEELLKNSAESVYADAGGVPTDFSPISEDEWKKLPEVAVMRVEPIEFQTGSNSLSDENKDQVDKIAKMLINNYPSYRVVVRGHTAPGSDENENLRLSLERAQVVMQRFIAVHSIDPDRLRAEGVGSKTPPAQRLGESYRTLLYRMPRVEIILLQSNVL